LIFVREINIVRTLIASDSWTYGSAAFCFGHRSGENASEMKQYNIEF